MGAKRQEREDLRQRLNRLTELYLEGDIGRERYKQERAELIERTMSLTFVGKSAIPSAARALEDFEATWAEASQLEKKKLLRVLVAVASGRFAVQSAFVSNSLSPCSVEHETLSMSQRDGCR